METKKREVFIYSPDLLFEFTNRLMTEEANRADPARPESEVDICNRIFAKVLDALNEHPEQFSDTYEGDRSERLAGFNLGFSAHHVLNQSRD
jgi:hypothetical protein